MSFGSKIDAVKNLLEPFTNHKVVKLSSLRDYFSEPNEADRVLKERGDVVVYEYYERIFGEGGGHINFGLTVMYPGKIGREYFLTRGHFHEKDAAEIYVGLKGVGYILMQTRDGKVEARVIEPDTVVYVPPGYGHRTINTGTEPLVFFFAYPSDAGHDYEAVKEKGFAKLVVEENGKPKLIDNPKYLMSPMV
ncbi:MAG: cupin domain-containing protein [Candidatus Caldarchaeum sp.]|nr:cupin domain-containing protein [Candidatus Caldarchaeum sp.]MDW8435074.1 glucose-6-phosphate isomerase family protein [Candidatus Caldarchaeum sp.]